MLTDVQLEEVKASLFSGQYNLLLGSGVSLDSFDRDGTPLLGAAALAQRLCTLKNAKPGTTLARVCQLLDADEQRAELTNRYLGCRPGDSVRKITAFVWKAAFTFNIDDALEGAYEAQKRRRQIINSLNYDTTYQSPANRSELPIIHLHGFAREHEKGYVFSAMEYGRVTRELNPWMHVLSELLASEPFIISGTSFNESDLEYYLAGRFEASPRKNRGPSILVEPFPDAVTESDCNRHGLILVKAKLGDFLDWLHEKLGTPPTVQELVIPASQSIFRSSTGLTQLEQVAFYSDFELLRPVPAIHGSDPSPFFYGRAPTWHDLESSFDISTPDEANLTRRARRFLDDSGSRRRVICVLDEAGTGKTTCLRRAAYNLAKENRLVISLNSKGDLDVDNAIRCFNHIEKPFVLLVDELANHASTVRALLTGVNKERSFLVLAAERQYRQLHVDRLLGDLPLEFTSMSSWPKGTLIQLIEKFRQQGLVGLSDALRHPETYAERLIGDAVAVAVCRILNNFKPLDVIVKSLWNDATDVARRSFLIAALAEYCYSAGVYFPVLKHAQTNPLLLEQLSLSANHPLPLGYADDDDYVLPLNATIGERILASVASGKKSVLLEIFVKLANSLAPYVNRQTIIARSPEARLSARLFQFDQVVRSQLGDLTDDFYAQTHNSWKWNSRYWEQRALSTERNDIDTALQYARHATAIESHPYPWTTLATILTHKMEQAPALRDSIFPEALDLLKNVFSFEERRGWRPTPHPYATLLHSVTLFIDNGGTMSSSDKSWVRGKIEKCTEYFHRDPKLQSLAATLGARL